MKQCSQCKETKPFSEFNKEKRSKDGYQYYCRDCKKKKYGSNKEVHKGQVKKTKAQRQYNAKNYVYKYLLKHPCVGITPSGCPYGESDPLVLEFDHIEPKEKFKSVAALISLGAPVEMIQTEIDKCRVLCANCHRRRTAIQKNWWKFTDCLYVKTEQGYTSVVGFPGCNSPDLMAWDVIMPEDDMPQ